MYRIGLRLAAASAVAACVACGGEEMSEAVGSDTQTDSQYLFGLTESELLDMHTLVADDYTLTEWLEFSSAPFTCARYDDLCSSVGEEAAFDITRTSYLLARDGASLAEIRERLDRDFELATESPELSGTDFRDSTTATVEYPGGQHRLRIRVERINPAFGRRFGRTECTHQRRSGIGVWGGNQSTPMIAFVENLDDPGSDAEADADVHKLKTEKIFVDSNDTVRGTCEGTRGGDTVDIARRVN
ncbi:MAG: hypothetical protein AAFQ65_07565 [Myxococcota bacterium]